jgi:hypothetical protein
MRIFMSGGGIGFIKWKDFTGYMTSRDETSGEFEGLRLFYRKSRYSKTIYLPRDGHDNDIMNFFAQYVPLIETLPFAFEIINLAIWQKVCLVASALCYSCVFSWLICKYHFLSQYAPLTIILGPGSICMAIMFRMRLLKNKMLSFYAFLYNQFAFFLIAIMIVLLMMYQIQHGSFTF